MSDKGHILIVGGGPSVSGVLPALTEKLFPNIIACNNAWEFVPWAQTLFFGDSRWWIRDRIGRDWGNREKVVKRFHGEIVTCAVGCDHPRVTKMRHTADWKTFLSRKDWLYGQDSGSSAISLAYRRGWQRIVLAGFDGPTPKGRPANFHDLHMERPNPANLRSFRRAHETLVEHLQKSGIAVVRITEPAPMAAPFLTVEALAKWAEDGYPSPVKELQ